MTDTTNVPAPLCFVDCETDGVHPGRKAWEIALIRRDYEPSNSPFDLRYRETEVTFFLDIDLATADPFGLQVGRFYERHPLGRWLATTPDSAEDIYPPAVDLFYSGDLDDWGPVSEREAAWTVARMTHGAHLVGVVPNFDAEVFAGLLRANGLTLSWHYHLVPVEAMAIGYLHGRAVEGAILSPRLAPGDLQPPWKSDDLAKLCGVTPPTDDERHTALGDARWARRWYDALTGMSASQDGDAR